MTMFLNSSGPKSQDTPVSSIAKSTWLKDLDAVFGRVSHVF